MKSFNHFNEYVQDALQSYWHDDALSDYGGITLQYKDVAIAIEKLHILYERAGLHPGDHIALYGRNSSHWAVAFMSILTYGAVAVPILNDFRPEQVHDIVNHSEAKLLLAGEPMAHTLSFAEMPHLNGMLGLPDFTIQHSRSLTLTQAREQLNRLFGEKYPRAFTATDIHYYIGKADEPALINYTSGTTSHSKGVLIPHRALWSNLLFAENALKIKVNHGSRVISILPMAHMYGMMFEFIYEFCTGCHVYFLGRTPSPQIIFKAFSEIRPDVVIAVPLIIEKIVRKAILPKLRGIEARILLRIPVVRRKIRQRIRQALLTAFGNNLYEIIVGGAALNSDIESFLCDIEFPFTVGYGATECAPIITYSDWKSFRRGSCGQVVPRMELKIDSPDPYHTVGEVLTRGANVMLGYYKNPEATAQALDAEGWYHTGDLGIIDADGYLYLKGRSRNMLLGASGQNIYPEEIEDALNALPYVAECVVIQRNEKLYALIYPDYDTAHKDGIAESDLPAIMERNRTTLNARLPAYEQLAGIVLTDTEFEKTPKKSIKRYLYADYDIAPRN